MFSISMFYLSLIILSVFILSVNLLSIVRLSVILPNVVAPDLQTSLVRQAPTKTTLRGLFAILPYKTFFPQKTIIVQ